MQKLKLSVVIPNHNYGHWLKDAANSVLTDPYPNKNLMIIDDGSTDKSWEVIQEIGQLKDAEHPTEDNVYVSKIDNTNFFAYHFSEAGGPSRARNVGIKVLWDYTDIFGFLDADDIYLPGKIEQSIVKLSSDLDLIGGVYTDYDTLDVNTGLRQRQYKEPFDYNRLRQECIIHSACMINKRALETTSFYPEDQRVAEDWSLWLDITKNYVFLHIPQSLMLVRIGTYNSTNSVPRSVWQECWTKIKEKINEI